jgi:hypothetical protein
MSVKCTILGASKIFECFFHKRKYIQFLVLLVVPGLELLVLPALHIENCVLFILNAFISMLRMVPVSKDEGKE